MLVILIASHSKNFWKGFGQTMYVLQVDGQIDMKSETHSNAIMDCNVSSSKSKKRELVIHE